jgi:hypothetical protein
VVTLSGTINLLGYSYGDLLLPVLGALIAILASLLGLYNYQELWIEYRTVTESLKHEKFIFLTKSEPYHLENAFSLLVNNVESLISKENTKWSKSIKNREEGKKG